MKRVFLTIILFAALIKHSEAEELKVNFNSVPLNVALTELSTQWNVPVSFNDTELSPYVITLAGSFSSHRDVLMKMTYNLPVSIRLISGVWVITSIKATKDIINEEIVTEKRGAIIEGVVMDATNGERLPFALIVYENKRFFADKNGYFSFRTYIETSDFSSLSASITYLGYNPKNISLVKKGLNRIFLTPFSYELDKVIVKGYITDRSFQLDDLPATIRVNHTIAKYLPGNSDNSVFNFLRMMPGVRAAGEPSYLSVWGSREGESLVIMDGYRIYAMNNFNDQISSVNPFMVKEIKLMKSAFPVNYGGVTGAIAQLTGLDGNSTRPALKSGLNNLTANIFASVPVGVRSVAMASYRQTFYNLYDIDKLNPFGNKPQSRGPVSSNDIFIIPDYVFRDANIRFRSLFGENNTVVASFYAANDNFKYNFETADFSYSAVEANKQYSFSINLNTITGNSGKTDFSVFYSSNTNESDRIRRVSAQNYTSYKTENLIGEAGTDINYKAEFIRHNFFTLGASFKFLFDDFNKEGYDKNLYTLYFNDRIILKNFEANIGLRYDSFLSESYVQPRLSAILNVGSGFKINAAYGIHHQYSGKIPYIDYDGNFYYLWKVFNGSTMPVIKSSHKILGLNFNKNGWFASADLFAKVSDGVLKFTRYRGNIRIVSSRFSGQGVDVMVNKELKGSNVFIATSLSSVKESFESSERMNLVYNPIEVKAGFLVNLNPFYLSATFVQGWGYRSLYEGISESTSQNNDYSRFDIAVNYRYSKKRYILNAGLSVLNLFNTLNYKYIDVIPNIQRGQSEYLSTYYQAIPFTPLISVEIHL